MKVYPEIVLFDPARADQAAPEFRRSDGPKLIYPAIAIEWIASGNLHGHEMLPRDWRRCLPDDIAEGYDYASNGRLTLAEQIIVGAIASGRLRCAHIEDVGAGNSMGDPIPRLSVTDPLQFREGQFQHEWDEGFIIRMSDADGQEDDIVVSDFMLFWDEVTALMPPSHGKSERPSEDLSPSFLATIPRPMPDASARSESLRGIIDQQISRGPRLSIKGGGSGKDGEPIAAFAFRVQSEGPAQFDGMPEKVLAWELAKEYDRLGLKLPNERNAGRNASGVIRAVKARMEMDGRDPV